MTRDIFMKHRACKLLLNAKAKQLDNKLFKTYLYIASENLLTLCHTFHTHKNLNLPILVEYLPRLKDKN